RVPCKEGLYAGYQTGRAWTFAGASIFLKLATVPAASTGTVVTCDFVIICAVPGTSIGFEYNAVTGTLRLMSNVDYWDPDAVELPYDPVAHLWLRLREDGTNVYWDTSPDGSTWTNRRTLATPAWVTTSIDDTAVDLWSYRDAGVEDYAAYDNVNTLSDGAVITGAGTGSAQSTASATGKRIAYGAGTAVAETVADAAGHATRYGSGTGSAQTHAMAFGAGSVVPEVAALAAGEWDLYIEQGATFLQRFTVDDDPAFTWDGWTARSQIRSEASAAGDLLLDLTEYLTVDGPEIRIQIPASVTETLTRNGRWDLEVVNGSTVVRLLNGRAIISPEVTR